jgi:hypothetical protein
MEVRARGELPEGLTGTPGVITLELFEIIGCRARLGQLADRASLEAAGNAGDLK